MMPPKEQWDLDWKEFLRVEMRVGTIIEARRFEASR
jgi:hypothetical protein